jgi:protein phosphatase
MTEDRPRLRVTAASSSITGPYRDHNEDNFFASAEGGVFVVADGMGGQQAGERASGFVVELLPPLLTDISKDGGAAGDVPGKIGAAIGQVNQKIHEYGAEHPECHQMGTTVVAALQVDRTLYVAGVGDSRVYHLREGHLRQITTDHTVTEALMRRGVISAEQAKVHKFRHVLWRYLGSPDLGEMPEVMAIDMEAGDRFLLASDGLTGVVEDPELTRILGSAETPQAAVEQLSARSQELDSHDNVTCVALFVGIAEAGAQNGEPTD